jgi:hypothetical protein
VRRGPSILLAALLAGNVLAPAAFSAPEDVSAPPALLRLTILPPEGGETLDPAVEAISHKLDRDLTYLLSSPLRATPKGAATLGVVLLGTLAMAGKDGDWSASLAGPRGKTEEEALDRLRVLGAHVPETALALYLAGYAFDSPQLKSGALQGAEAVAFTALFSAVSAPLIGHADPRQAADSRTFRPFDRYHAMPDMEAGMAFALASAFSYGRDVWTEAGCYLLAGGVALARARHRAAWPSDLFLGAVLGIAVGRTIPSLSSPDDAVSLGPSLIDSPAGPAPGVALTFRY